MRPGLTPGRLRSLDVPARLECKGARVRGTTGLDDVVIPLADSFAEASRADWLALVEKTLKGAQAESLVSRTADGIEVQPLYDASASPPLPSWRAAAGE